MSDETREYGTETVTAWAVKFSLDNFSADDPDAGDMYIPVVDEVTALRAVETLPMQGVSIAYVEIDLVDGVYVGNQFSAAFLGPNVSAYGGGPGLRELPLPEHG